MGAARMRAHRRSSRSLPQGLHAGCLRYQQGFVALHRDSEQTDSRDAACKLSAQEQWGLLALHSSSQRPDVSTFPCLQRVSTRNSLPRLAKAWGPVLHGCSCSVHDTERSCVAHLQDVICDAWQTRAAALVQLASQ